MVPLELKLPWASAEPNLAERAEAEVSRTLAPGHALEGLKIEAIAHRVDRDDVLFKVESSQYVIVHLSFSRERERDPRWPSTRFFDSLEEWCQKAMLPDHEEYSA